MVMVRYAVTLAFVAGLALGGGSAATATTPTEESAARSGLTACALRDEAIRLGLSPWTMIPGATKTCALWLRTVR